MTLERVVEYKDLFPEEIDNIPDVKDLIVGINRKKLITMLSNMVNILVEKPFYDPNLKPDNKEYTDYLRFFLSKDNKNYILEIISRYRQFEKRSRSDGFEGPFIATRVAAVMMLERLIFSLSPCYNKYDCKQEVIFFKALLIINQIVNNAVYDCAKDIQLPLNLRLANVVLAYSFSNEGNEFEDYHDVYRRQMVRMKELFVYANNRKTWKPLRKLFFHNFGIKHWTHYLIPHTFVANKIKGKSGVLIMKNCDRVTKTSLKIIRKCSIDYNEVIPFEKNKDYSEFKSRPFIQLDKHHFVVVNGRFVIEHLYESMYFQLKKYRSFAGYNNDDDYRRDFTTDFTQNWMLNRFMSYCLTGTEKCVLTENDSNDIKTKQNRENVHPIDYYIHVDEGVLLFELKDTLSSAKTKDKRDAEVFFNDLYERFCESTSKNDKLSPKGVKQLLLNVQAIQDGTFIFDNVRRDETIYPIIVVDSTYYTMRGVHTKLEYWMRDFCNSSGISDNTVKPLILMDISTLRLYADSFKKEGFIYYFEKYYSDISFHNNNLDSGLNSLKSFSEFMNDKYNENIESVFKQVMSEVTREFKKYE